MKNSLFLFCFLISTTTFAQTNRNETLLSNEEDFNIAFMFQIQDKTPFSIIFSREDDTDYLLITNDTCRQNHRMEKRTISDIYAYEQMLNYFDNINIRQFQPKESLTNSTIKMQVQCSILINDSRTMNSFVFLYNPNNIGEEKNILELISQVITDNVFDSCDSNFAEQFEAYVSGTE